MPRWRSIDRRRIERLGELVLRLCVEPRGFEDMLKLAFDDLGLELNFQQYALAGSTLSSFPRLAPGRRKSERRIHGKPPDLDGGINRNKRTSLTSSL